VAGLLSHVHTDACSPGCAVVHDQDEHCSLDDENVCTVCGVWFADVPCECGGRGFHRPSCSYHVE
jgi:hypothetical protein